MTKVAHLRTIPRLGCVSKFNIPKFEYDSLAVIKDVFPTTTTCTEANVGP